MNEIKEIQKCEEILKNKNKARYIKYSKNNEKVKEYQKRWNKNHTGRYKYKYNGKYNKKALECMETKRFGGNREKVLLRDNFKCIICNLSNEEHKIRFNRNLTIDHIDGNGRKSKNPNNDLKNLRTLCLTCHGRIDGKRGEHKLKDNKNIKLKLNVPRKVSI